MINQKRLFNVNDQIFSLLTSSSNPNILIPVRGVVQEIKHDLTNPLYKIKIEGFYDTWPFLKNYFLDNNYTYSFTDRPRPCKIKNINSLEQLMDRLQNSPDNDRYYIVVDALMSFKFYYEMEEGFEKIQSFIIHKKMRELMEFQTRTFYKGKFRIDTQKKWYINARNIIDSEASDTEYKKIVDNF
jgi:hypothetical protein